jgi:phenylacetic acid degradation operon negative regulatory protein
MVGSVTPRNVVLNLVRTSGQDAQPVSRLVAVADLFGFTENALRVAVARLVADGLLESDERGSYRLGSAAAPVQAHVEDWRKGEQRMRAWNGEWLSLLLQSKFDRAHRRASLKALSRLGFRESHPGLWVRPDNLAQSFPQSIERLRSLGLEDNAEAFRSRDFSDVYALRLGRQWPARALMQGYERSLRDLQRSLRKLLVMPRQTALVQSFLLGGEAIRVLATDPLLPEEIVASAKRRELTELMLRYDSVGRRIWRSFASGPELKLVKGGRDVD